LIDPVVDLALRASLALLFATSALAKLRDLDGFAAAVAGYELLPRWLARPASRAFVALELALAAALSLPSLRVLASLGFASLRGTRPLAHPEPEALAAALGGASLLALYAFAIAVNLARGRRHIDCGCGGPAGRQAISGPLVLRNALLALAALALCLPVAARPFRALDFLTLLAAVAASAFLYAAANALLLRPWAPR